ncbi:MAG: DUF2911 domain-containing protein [Bacteroidota bacterium]|nr:DUF2911 domain-containing protein [Bacteroidota bacterium]
MRKILCFLALLITITGFAQGRKSPHDTINTKDVSVAYGRPSMHGRTIFGELVKFGKVWRLGADEATTIQLDKETKFGGTTVPAGTYTLFALVNEGEWTIIFNSVLGQWGAFSYEKNKASDVAQVTVPVEKLATPVEQLTMRFDDDKAIVIEWELMHLKIQVKTID